MQKFFKLWRTKGLLAAVQKTITYLTFQINIYLHNNVKFITEIVEPVPNIYKKNAKAIKIAKKYITAPIGQHVCISNQYSCVYGHKQNFSNTTTVIVAHWDPEQLIDPYVEQYCLHFKSLGYKVVISSAQYLVDNAVLQRCEDFCDAILYRTCTGYDFTSWKAALDCFPSLFKCKELILTNDSCFGPFSSFQTVHMNMEQVLCDFWGMTYSADIAPHLQSYYLVVKTQVLQHACFRNFIDSIDCSPIRKESIAFETSFTLWLCIHGFIAGAYCQPKKKAKANINPTLFYSQNILRYGVPILKREKIYMLDGFYTFLEYKDKIEYKAQWDAIHNYIVRLGGLCVTPSSFCMRRANEVGPIKYHQYRDFPQGISGLYTDVQQNIKNLDTLPTSIAVAIHCFYPEALHMLISYLNNLPNHVHVYITTDTKQKKESILSQLQSVSFEKLQVVICPNIGWDMAPFFVGLADIIQGYEYILKVHVKMSTNMKKESAKLWCEVLYEALLGSKDNINKILANFDLNSKLGVIAPPSYPPYALPIQGPNHENMNLLLAKKGLHLPVDACIDFPVGGMFWCRSKALEPLFELDLHYEDFVSTFSDPMQRDGTLAHALERLIFFGCGMGAMQWGRIKLPNNNDVK